MLPATALCFEVAVATATTGAELPTRQWCASLNLRRLLASCVAVVERVVGAGATIIDITFCGFVVKVKELYRCHCKPNYVTAQLWMRSNSICPSPYLLYPLQLLYLANEDPTKDIAFYINSPGGSISAEA